MCEVVYNAHRDSKWIAKGLALAMHSGRRKHDTPIGSNSKGY